MALGVNGTTSVPQAGYNNLLTPLSLLSEQWGVYKDFVEVYPHAVKECYILATEASGNLSYTPTLNFSHYEALRDLPHIQSTAEVTGLAGADIVITLTAASHTGAGARSPIAVGFVYENITSGQVYEIVEINKDAAGAHTATLRISDSAEVPLVAVADYLVYRGNAYTPEGSDQGDGLYRESARIDNQCRRIRSDKEFTDLVLFEKLSSPEGGYKFKDAQIAWEISRHFLHVQEMLLMFGIDANNLGAGNTEGVGLLPNVIESVGNLVAGSTAVDAAFWQTLKRYFAAEGYTDEFDMLADTELFMKIEEYLGATYNNGAVIHADVPESKRPMEIARNFKSYDVHGIKYNLLDYYYFSPSRSHGVPLGTANQYEDSAVLIPVGMARDNVSGLPMPRFGVRYQAEAEGLPPVKTAVTGMYAPVATDPEAVQRFHTIAYKGLQLFGAQGYGYVKLSA